MDKIMQQIEEARKEKEISVDALTKEIGVCRTTYYKWIDGSRKPKIKKIKKMCDMLELNFLEMIDKFI